MRNQLSYRAPEILRELADLVMPGAENLVALDLGCGTGLAAEAFVDIAPTMDGIDLSPQMIEKSRARRLYRNLHVADIETGLARAAAEYDLVLAADTLVYLGDLTATFSAVAQRLKSGGYFLFTVEKSAGPDFELGPKRRWRHSESYIRRIAAAEGFDVAGLAFLFAAQRGGRAGRRTGGRSDHRCIAGWHKTRPDWRFCHSRAGLACVNGTAARAKTDRDAGV